MGKAKLRARHHKRNTTRTRRRTRLRVLSQEKQQEDDPTFEENFESELCDANSEAPGEGQSPRRDGPGAPGSPVGAGAGALSDISNSPAVLSCQPAQRVYGATESCKKREDRVQAGAQDRASTAHATPRKRNLSGPSSPPCPTSKRLELDESADPTDLNDSDWETEQTPLHVQFDGRGDGLDQLTGYHVVSLPHVLRQHKPIANHTCARKGRMVMGTPPRNEGLFSVLHFQCTACGETAKIETNPKGPLINQALAWGTVAVGMGHSQSEEFMSVLNVRAPSEGYFRKCERLIGEVWTSFFDMFRSNNVEEEKKLAREEGRVDRDGMPYTTVKLDGGWSSRCYGHGYAAKSGVGVVISKFTRAILNLGTENKFCKQCSDAESKGEAPDPDHKCNATYKGPSTGMESSIIVKGLKALYNEGLWVNTIIGDGDSSVYNKVRQFTQKGSRVRKEECANHSTRRYTSRLHGISKNTKIRLDARKLLDKVLPRLTAAARGAIRTNAGKSLEKLRADLRNGPYHVFGDHNNCCDSYCKRKDAQEPNEIEEAKALGVIDLVYGALQPMYSEAHKLTSNETTNDCESYMSRVVKFTGGKRVDFSTGPSYDIRCHGAALAYSLGPAWHLTVWLHWQGESMGTVAEAVLGRRQVRCERKRLAKDARREARLAGEWTGRKKPAGGGADKDYGATYDRLLQEYPDVDELELAKRMMDEVKRLQAQVPDEEASREWEVRTRGQSGNPLWREFREKRLQGYLLGRIVRMGRLTPRANTVQDLLFAKDIDHLEHIQLGRTAEAEAKEKYSVRFGVEVQECGSFVRPDLPYLLASPDGLVGEDGLVEVKNFSKLGKKGILETFNDRKNRKKLRGILKENVVKSKQLCTVNGKRKYKTVTVRTSIEPNPDNPVFVQVQSQLNLSKRKWCDLILHCDVDWEVFRILRDENMFESKMKPKLEQFYYDAFLPEVVDGRLMRGLPPREPKYVIEERLKKKMKVIWVEPNFDYGDDDDDDDGEDNPDGGDVEDDDDGEDNPDGGDVEDDDDGEDDNEVGDGGDGDVDEEW